MKTIAFLLIALLTLFSTVNGNISANNLPSNAAQVQDTIVLGKLYFHNLKEGEKPIITGLTLSGNRCGTEALNSKAYATEGIRCVFELDEWIEFYPESNAVTGIKVMVFQHKTDQGFYLKNTLNDETPGYVLESDLNKDPDAEENSHWGSFYLHPEEVQPGYYDFVFIYNKKVFATMVTKFYKLDELLGKPDSDLEKLMKQPISN